MTPVEPGLILFDHGHRPSLIVDGFAEAALRIGQTLRGYPVDQLPPNPCAALALCVAERAPCAHGQSALLAVIGDGGVAVRCAGCWPGTVPPKQCPTCRSPFTSPLWMVGLFTGCRRCGELLIPDYTGLVRVVLPELLTLLTPTQRKMIDLVREDMVCAGASA